MSSLVILSHLTRATSRRMLMTRSLHTSIRTSALPVTRSIVSLTQASHLPCLCSAMARTRITSSPSNTSRRHFASATDASVKRENVRNFAIIAHVDHGKTTLVDGLLRQSITHISSEATCVMDSNQLEKERGITILAKCTSVLWKAPTTGENYQLNIVDTPGHADFGGEVERIMSMVDGVCLVVDATDGPMTQTKFVLSKALAKGLRPIVVINKVDRPTARVGDVENEIFDLFVSLNATDEQMDFPIVYASGKNGWSHLTPKETGTNMNPLFETCIRHIPAPQVDVNAPFSMLVTQIDSHPFFGKLLVGRVQTGTVKTGDAVHAIDPEGKKLEAIKIIKILSRRGLEQIIVDDAQAGDIIALAGFGAATVNSTLCDTKVTKPIPSTPIDPPTVSMTFSPNDSPFGGKEGKYLTSGAIGERLKKEAESNVSLKVMPSTVSADAYDVHGRGELQLGILIETMRRESYELSVSPPRVVMKKEPNGKTLEPMEEVILDCDQEHSGQVIEKLANRKGEMVDFINMEGGGARLIFRIPMRGLIGYRAEFQNDTSGQGQLNHIFHSYVEYKGEIERNKNGSLVSMSEGVVTAFALDGLESRGILFIAPGDKVYNGQVVGEHAKETDLEVNAAKTKMLTNVRSTVKEDKTRLSPPKIMSLEEMIAYCRDDEVIEVTPTALRLRKRILDQGERDKAMRAKKQAREREREAEKANRSSA